MYSIGLQMYCRMEWKRSSIEEFREIRGGIVGVIIRLIFFFIVLVMTKQSKFLQKIFTLPIKPNNWKN